MSKKRRRQRGAPSTQQRSGGRYPQTDLITAETANPQRKLTSGRDPGPVDLLLLQRTVGNQAVARLIAGQNSDAIQRGPEEENKGKKSGGGKWSPKLKPRKSPTKKNKSRPKKKTKRRVFPKAPAKGTGALLNDRLDTFKNFKTAYSKGYTELPAHMLEAMINKLNAKIAPQKETVRKLEENVTKATEWDEVMATRTLLQKVTYGPFAPKSAEFNLIGKHLTDFHNDSRSYKFNPDKWFTNLQSLSTAVKNWLSKYDSMWKSRKGVRNAIKELKKQVEVGLKKLKGVQPDRKRAKELGERWTSWRKRRQSWSSNGATSGGGTWSSTGMWHAWRIWPTCWRLTTTPNIAPQRTSSRAFRSGWPRATSGARSRVRFQGRSTALSTSGRRPTRRS